MVLISIDTCRADALGCYGRTPSPTPNLDRLAAEGVLFVNTLSPIPMTTPAHASLMTGLGPSRHGIHFNMERALHPDVDTLAEILGRRGFATGGFVSALTLDRRYGLDQGFTDYDDDLSARRRGVFGAERPGAETVELATRWLRIHRYERFFLFVHLYEPHEPYEPPPEFAKRFPSSPYLGEVAAADAYVGRLLDELRKLDVADSTLVVVVGDHGEMLGEHGEEGHTYFVYQSALHVPFLVRLPQRTKATRLERLVGLVDVTPTVCGLLSVPPPPGVDGVDLSPLVLGRGQPPPARAVTIESLTPIRYGANPLHGVVDGRWKLIHTTRPELYDLVQDPGETRDLASLEPGVVAEQQRLLAARLAQAMLVDGAAAPPVDPEVARRLAAIGYAPNPPEAELDVDPSRPDPKDLIAVHVANIRAVELLEAGQFAAAEPLARQVLAGLPDFWEAHVSLGRALLGLGRWEEAVTHLERSLELKPAQYDALKGLGRAFCGLGQLEKAADCYRRALPTDPDPPSAALALARVLIALGRVEEADAYLAQSARLASGRPDALAELARVLDARGQGEQAEAARAEALALARASGREDLLKVLRQEGSGS